jgi:RNA polymerase II subunit A small phosphatase-like protein
MEKLIILDLDETLIHASDHRLPIESTYFEVGHYYVYKRPYLDQFLEFCLSEFKVAVWTSSNALYAKPVIEEIFKSEDNLQFWWSREKCTWKFDPETQSYDWLKDLKKVRRKGFNLEHVIMIDDTP